MVVEPCIRESIMGNKDVSTSFYLTIFEKQCASVCRMNTFELKDMGLNDFGEELNKLDIYLDLKQSTILSLEKISSIHSKSKHVIICISGFLTQDVEKKDSWRHTLNHYKNAELYALNWNSLSTNEFFE